MKKWFSFEVLYKKENPMSFTRRNKIFINFQSVYSTNEKEAEEQAIKSFELERLGDKLISIRLINE